MDFAEFYEHNRDGCLSAVYASVGDWQVAEELVSESFARAWASWRRVSRHPAPASWIVRTALNTHVSWWSGANRISPGESHRGYFPGVLSAAAVVLKPLDGTAATNQRLAKCSAAGLPIVDRPALNARSRIGSRETCG
jgi:DNA-directed RNA polymerase specialized sigma24 family protein